MIILVVRLCSAKTLHIKGLSTFWHVNDDSDIALIICKSGNCFDDSHLPGSEVTIQVNDIVR